MNELIRIKAAFAFKEKIKLDEIFYFNSCFVCSISFFSKFCSLPVIENVVASLSDSILLLTPELHPVQSDTDPVKKNP